MRGGTWIGLAVLLLFVGCGGGGGGDSGEKPNRCPLTELRLNGTFLGEGESGELLYELPESYEDAVDYTAEILYLFREEGYVLKSGAETIESGDSFTFPSIRYGDAFTLECFLDGVNRGTLTVRFTNLPVIRLDSDRSIPDEPKVEGNFSLQSERWDDHVEDQLMGIEIRGHTALWLPKKSYSVELRKDDACLSGKKLRLLGLRKDDDWIMDAAYRDTTFVRNILSHDLFNAMRPYAYRAGDDILGQATIRGRVTEVILNGEYNGVYVFEERVDRKLLDLEKIDVEEDGCDELWSEVNFSDPRNGSLLFKAESSLADFNDKSELTAGYEQVYPDGEDVARWEVLEALVDFVANSSDEDFIAEVADRFDLENLADYWCLVMAARGTDNIRKNYYLARSGEGKFFLVPWDLDATWGIRWTGEMQEDPTSWFGGGESRLFARLLAHPEIGFVERIVRRWKELRLGVLDEEALMERFEAYRKEVEIGGAAERTFVRYPDSGGDGSSDQEQLRDLSYLESWIERRMAYVDGEVAGLPEARNLIPVADAGGWRVVDSGETVMLDGNASYDPEGDSLQWRWRQVEGDAVELEGVDTPTATFTAPTGPQRLLFELEVLDGEGNRARSRAVVWVKASE